VPGARHDLHAGFAGDFFQQSDVAPEIDRRETVIKQDYQEAWRCPIALGTKVFDVGVLEW
jgi:hypothetical protein